MGAFFQKFEKSFARIGLLWLAAGCLALLTACPLDSRDVGVSPVPIGGAGGGGDVAPCAADCPEVICPLDDVCRDYASQIPAGSCSASGGCASVDDCVFEWKPIAPDGVGCECGAGGCRLAAGAACTLADACASASCLATNAGSNLCCAAACAPNEACRADGSGCEPLAACDEGARRCSGSSYQQCSDGIWTSISECGTLGCDQARGGCLRSVGQACEADGDCGEGACVETPDGGRVCCTADCQGPCRRCAASGTECENLADDAACGSIACPSDDPCRLYAAPSVEAGRCIDGACASPEQACSFAPQNVGAECNPSTLCDDAGNCSLPKLAANAACSVASECQSGACVASAAGGSVCCASACAPNELCGAAGECELAPVCEDGATQCSGSSFQRCNAGQWAILTECGALGCSEEAGGCRAGAGDECASDDDCGAGSCQATSTGERVCCTAACEGACRRCAPSGLECEALDDDAACGNILCPQSSPCSLFPPSVSAGRCIDGRCGTPGQLCVGTPTNVGQSCSATSLCDAAGNCSRPKRVVGATCDENAECASNFCVDGLCCNERCGGDCETCAGDGICRGAADDASCDDIACGEFDSACVANPEDITTNRCRERGVCKTQADCGFQPSRTPCGGDLVGFCDGRGSCNPVTLACGGACEQALATTDACCSVLNEYNCFEASECLSTAPGNVAITCYDHLDCAPGTVCCRSLTEPRVECVPQAACDAQLCGSPSQPVTVLQCPFGTRCEAVSPGPNLLGFSFCQ